ncbi:valine--tRNA ligase [Candidatus Kaiserbacteria bacterium]|nr:valine--tRNA ligase [Candidatus Kaiserbacteria bacterium]
MLKDGSFPTIPEVFLKPYNSVEREPWVNMLWDQKGYANPDICIKLGITAPDAPTYSIVLPPPNVTGTLHMGHASMLAIQDILIRYHRMRGYRTLWLPGTDHAAIATQSVVEKKVMKEEKLSRHDLGRDELLRRIQQFATESHDMIVGQIRAMGASVDWTREAFTLDAKRNHAVNTAFKRMYDAGLIYRGNRIVNWDPKGQTTISDDEIVYEERDAKMYTFRYSKDFPISISTTRPETKVGDTAVAVHPEDERYQQYIGKEYTVVFCDVPLHIRIIADKSVEKDFGTGALGVTPAHSNIDWEIADRHDLPRPQVINEYAKMTVPGPLEGKKVTEAREMVVEWLHSQDLLEGEVLIKQNVSTAERTGGIVEPLPKLQWFVSVDKPFVIPHSEIPGIPSGASTTLKALMHAAVGAGTEGTIKIVPERFERVYNNWIDNLRPWCISRQIWYGHRIPVWYHEPKCIPKPGREEEVAQCEMVVVSGTEPICEHCDAKYFQDADTLDTWFSSGLWTFSTLGWPDDTADLRDYHPTSVLETGYDIIFFWVARMILMSAFHLGTIPFKNVYLHGLVRDAQGRKMSKSLGNILNPLEMIEKYGADATRLSLIVGASPGNDLKLSEDRVRGYKHFANKVWNVARFVLESADTYNDATPYVTEDAEIMREVHRLAEEVSQQIDSYRIDLAADLVYHFIWHRFADEIIEQSKLIIKAGAEEAAIASKQRMLREVLVTLLKLLHPFMPFVTETIWQNLPEKESDLLMVAPWPSSSATNNS